MVSGATAVDESPKSSGDKETTPKVFRRDIQGLRAVAVVLVVLAHLFYWPSGGFLGVDVFFVISGFLITGLLIREAETTGSISLRAFYARRVRRILPAAILVLTVTVVIAVIIWFPLRALETTLDAFWSAIFMSNWHFAASGSDYFATTNPSPALHYWSLAVEEQFYAFWPLGVLVVALIAGRRGARLRTLIAAMAGVCIVISLGWAAWRTTSDPQAVYFDSIARGWELLAGAVIATLPANRLPDFARKTMAVLGLALIFASALFVQETSGIPFPWVIPAVVGTALVIWSNASTGTRGLLGNPVSQWLGNISYSLYLWHFPVIVFTVSVFGDSTWTRLATIPVMLVLAALSKRWVEDAFLKSSILRKTSRLRNERAIVPRDLVSGLLVVGVIATLTAVAIRGPVVMHDTATLAERLQRFESPTPVAMADDETVRSAEVQAALNQSAWPDSIRRFDSWQLALRSDDRDCMNRVTSDDQLRWCGKPENADVLVIGDSVSLSWLPTIDAAAEDLNLTTAGIGFGGCQLAGGLRYTHPTYGATFPQRCADMQNEMIAEIKRLAPEMLVLTGHPGVLSRMDVGVEDAASLWETAYADMLAELSEIDRIVVLEANPWNQGLSACLVSVVDPASCSGTVDAWHSAKSTAEEVAIESSPSAEYIGTRAWFCDGGACPPFVADTLITTDGLHLTAPAGTQLAQLLAESLPSD